MRKKIFILLSIISIFILNGCSTKKGLMSTNNEGGYTINFGVGKIKKDNEDVIIRGHVFDLKTRKLLSNAKLKTGCFEFRTTSDGEYSFRTRNREDDSFFVEVIAFSYRALETKFINIYNQKEVIIDFYLAKDDRPLIECEGDEMIKKMQEELNNLK